MSEPNGALNNALVLIEMLRRIPRTRFVSSRELHEQLVATGRKLSMRTVQRHLETLAHHFPIECDTRSKPYGYRWMEGAQGLHLPTLSPTESLLLALASEYIGPLLPARKRAALAPLFVSALRSLDGVENRRSPELRWLTKVARCPDSQPLLPPRVAPKVLETVSEALYTEHKLRVRYRNLAQKINDAVVWPLGLVMQGARPYLVCRFEGYADERILALPRIESVTALAEAFPWPREFDLKRYVASGRFGVLTGPLVRLRFKIDRRYGEHLLESPLSDDQTAVVGSQALEITATVPETELLHRWLRSWGDALQLLECIPIDGGNPGS